MYMNIRTQACVKVSYKKGGCTTLKHHVFYFLRFSQFFVDIIQNGRSGTDFTDIYRRKNMKIEGNANKIKNRKWMLSESNKSVMIIK